MDTIAEMTLAPTDCPHSLSDVASAALPRLTGVRWRIAEADTRLEMSGPMQEVLACVQRVRHALRSHGLVAASTRVRRVEARPAAPSRAADRALPPRPAVAALLAPRPLYDAPPLSIPVPAVAAAALRRQAVA